MKVLIVSAWDPKSGVLSVYRSLAHHLKSEAVRFSAFAFDGWTTDTWWTFCDELVDGRKVTLAETLMTGRYDIVHCIDTAYAPPYGVEKWVRRARFRGPVVLMAQQVARRQFSGPVHATRYVACSQAAADLLAQDADGPVAVIPNGYDEKVFLPASVARPDRPLLVWVGRSYDPVKGVDLFLDAVEQAPECDAVIVDTGTGSAIQSRLNELGSRVSHRQLLAPEEIAALFREAAASGGAYISTSTSEAFSLAAIEAMACDCPVIAPRIPGYEHLRDGSNALVYRRDHGSPAIQSCLDRLTEPGFRNRVIRKAREEALTCWTSCVMADAYLRLYQEAVGARSRSRLTDPTMRASWRLLLMSRPWVSGVRRIARRALKRL